MAPSKNMPRPQIRTPVRQSGPNRVSSYTPGANANSRPSPSGMPENSTESTREAEEKEEWASIDLNSPDPNSPNSPENTYPKPHQDNRCQPPSINDDDNSTCPCSGCRRVEMLHADVRRSVNKWPSTLEEWLTGVKEAGSEAPVGEGDENEESALVSEVDEGDADCWRRP